MSCLDDLEERVAVLENQLLSKNEDKQLVSAFYNVQVYIHLFQCYLTCLKYHIFLLNIIMFSLLIFC